MTKYLLNLLILSSMYSAVAASASWTGIRVSNVSYSDTSTMGYSLRGGVSSDSGASASIYTTLFGYEKNGKFFLQAFDYSTVSVPLDNVWYLAFYGDVINSETLRHVTSLDLFSYGEEKASGTCIEDRRDFYLVFEASEYNVENGMTWYGWTHLSVDDNLGMTVLESGIGLNGEAVRVGYSAIPEPSSALLLLLGGAGLLLKRGRCSEVRRPTSGLLLVLGGAMLALRRRCA